MDNGMPGGISPPAEHIEPARTRRQRTVTFDSAPTTMRTDSPSATTRRPRRRVAIAFPDEDVTPSASGMATDLPSTAPETALDQIVPPAQSSGTPPRASVLSSSSTSAAVVVPQTAPPFAHADGSSSNPSSSSTSTAMAMQQTTTHATGSYSIQSGPKRSRHLEDEGEREDTPAEESRIRSSVRVMTHPGYERTIVQLKAEIDDLTASNRTLEDDLLRLNSRIGSESERNRAQSDEQNQGLLRELAEANNARDNMRRSLNEATRDATRAVEQITALDASLADATAAKTSLETQLATAQADSAKTELDLQAARTEMANIQSEGRSLQEELTRLRGESTSTTANGTSMANLQSEIAQLKRNQEAQDRAAAETQSHHEHQLSTLRNELRGERTKLANMERENAKLKTALRSRSDTSEIDINDLRQQVITLQRKLDLTNQQNADTINQLIEEHEQELDDRRRDDPPLDLPRHSQILQEKDNIIAEERKANEDLVERLRIFEQTAKIAGKQPDRSGAHEPIVVASAPFSATRNVLLSRRRKSPFVYNRVTGRASLQATLLQSCPPATGEEDQETLEEQDFNMFNMPVSSSSSRSPSPEPSTSHPPPARATPAPTPNLSRPRASSPPPVPPNYHRNFSGGHSSSHTGPSSSPAGPSSSQAGQSSSHTGHSSSQAGQSSSQAGQSSSSSSPATDIPASIASFIQRELEKMFPPQTSPSRYNYNNQFKTPAKSQPRPRDTNSMHSASLKLFRLILGINHDRDILAKISANIFPEVSEVEDYEESRGPAPTLTPLRIFYDEENCRWNHTLATLFARRLISEKSRFAGQEAAIREHFMNRVRTLKAILSRIVPREGETDVEAASRLAGEVDRSQHDKRIRGRKVNLRTKRENDCHRCAATDPDSRVAGTIVAELGDDGNSSDETDGAGTTSIHIQTWRNTTLLNQVALADACHSRHTITGARKPGGLPLQHVRKVDGPISTRRPPRGKPFNYYHPDFLASLAEDQLADLAPKPAKPFPGENYPVNQAIYQ